MSRTLRSPSARALTIAALALLAASAGAQQPLDSAYTAQIRALTPTDPHWKFTTELVDHLPASATVPTPLKVLGYVPGTVGRLSHVADVNRYFRALAAATPRVQVFSLGLSDEGREMIVAAIADDSVMARLDAFRGQLGRLADPRGLPAAERASLLASAKPIYWMTGTIHSPETGSPEMLMELAYRLAVEETPFIKAIRANVITLMTPVLEVDGRDREVDLFNQSRALKLGPFGGNLIYWGKYTAHDNNRDGMVMSQKLTQNFVRGFLHWHPVVAHDLHESVPFLYTSTGTGPYNEDYDPIVIDEWHSLAYEEITELTRRGLPGVWTHGFYDGWAPNYTILSVANLHNAIGRFYETYTSRGADCHTVKLPASATEREWDRPSPPVNGVKWCIRSNINYQQSALLIALKYVADHRATFLENYVAKAERMIARGQTSAPYAYVIPHDQTHAAEAADLVNLFRAQGAEVQRATAAFEVKREAPARPAGGRRGAGMQRDTTAAARDATTTVHAGDWVVRMDQPYAGFVRNVLEIQHYKPTDPQPYDDTGWTLDALRHVLTIAVADSAVLTQPMAMLTADAEVTGSVSGDGAVLLVRHDGDWRAAVFPWKAGAARIAVADTAFSAGGATYPAGTFVVSGMKGNAARDAVRTLGLEAAAMSAAPAVPTHAITLPRIALIHTWLETQNEGWVRFAFDQMGVPFTYLGDQGLKNPGALDKFDVVVFPHVRGFGGSLLNGRPMVGPPIPWQKRPATPNLGMWDSTADMRPGMGLEGAAALRHFVERGGMLLVEGASTEFPIELGFNSTVRVVETRGLRANGGVFRAQPVDKTSPILYGYPDSSFAVYFNQSPVLAVQPRDTSADTEGIDPAVLDAAERMRARVILRFPTRADSLLISGLLVGGDELAGKAAVVNAPLGNGHVVMFAIRPFWRWESQGSFALALNAIANWNALGH